MTTPLFTAAILCGGYGARIRHIIGEHQKCAVYVGGRPWIHYLLDGLDRAPVSRVILLTGYQPQEIEDAARSWAAREGVLARHAPRNVSRIEILHSSPAGPEAAIETAFVCAANELLVINGDTMILDFDLKAFLEEARARPSVNLTVRAPSLLTGAVADAGVSYERRPAEFRSALRIEAPFLDIGSPEGLEEARRRCLA